MKRCSCFLLNYHQEQIKRKKRRGYGKYFFKKEQNKEFTTVCCRRYMSLIENHILGNLYNELFSESTEESTVRYFKVQLWFLIVHKMLLKTTQLFSKHFPPGLPLCIFRKQPPRGVPRKRCSENIQQIYRRTLMPK